MRSRLAWAAGALGLAGALYRAAASKRRLAPAPDPRAEELRRKLAESRDLVGEREEFESAETTVDRAEPVGADPESLRRQIHERGRAAAEEMRRPSAEE